MSKYFHPIAYIKHCLRNGHEYSDWERYGIEARHPQPESIGVQTSEVVMGEERECKHCKEREIRNRRAYIVQCVHGEWQHEKLDLFGNHNE